MRKIVAIGKSRRNAADRTDTAYLIGSPIAPTKAHRSCKPKHPCYLVADEEIQVEEPLSLFDIIDVDNKIELQFGALVVLSIDSTARETVAAHSPPKAAQLTRKIPEILHKALLGTASSTAQPVAELTIRFAYEIERIYHSPVTAEAPRA